MPHVRIYTRTGDRGETGLFGGARVSKASARVEAYGAVDELNAVIGLARAQLRARELQRILERVQHELFIVGADLATPPQAKTSRPVPRIGPGQVRQLERDIDGFEAQLPPLSRFVLPGGAAGAPLHLARTVCRRAERRVVAASQLETLNPQLVVYLNRLGDLLFVMARRANQLARVPETLWR
jgi:cob(I)alamin adenosyltransferase